MSTLKSNDDLVAITDQFTMKLDIESSGLDEETTNLLSFKEATREFPLFNQETSESSLHGEETTKVSHEEIEDEEFSFFSARFDSFSASDMLNDGPIFPVFDQTLLESGDYPIKKLLVESQEGTFREWAGNSRVKSPETCEKSNSTGFSNMWRVRELGHTHTHRSSSDGRDAFVFLKKESEKKEKVSTKGNNGNTNINKKGKGKTTTSAHEMHYVENRNRREMDKKRSYLPYRTEFFGFFTSVRGGLTKNVHPY